MIRLSDGQSWSGFLLSWLALCLPALAECPAPALLDEALALVAEANPVLSAEREQFEEQAQQKSWEIYLSLGYATNTTFEAGEAGGSAAIRVRIPLFDRAHELKVAQARTAWRHAEDTLLQTLLTDLQKLCAQAAKVRELDTLRQFYLDRLKYRQERVAEGLDEAPVLWAESEQVQKAEQDWRREAQALAAQRLTLARQYAATEWKRLQVLLGGMTP